MLYDLVSYKKALRENFDVEDVVAQIELLCCKIQNIKHQVPRLDNEQAAYIDSVTASYNELIEQVRAPIERNKQVVKELDDKITAVSKKLFADSYELEERNGGIDNVRKNRRITVNADIEQTIKQRILLYTDWKYPALEIGCRDGEWTQYLVAADPLYIVDPFTEFLNSANKCFPEQYQNRLRKYVMKDHNLDQLPKNQFAFVFSWSHFNYVSLDTITHFLKQLKTLMRPGGVFMFSYNNGDTPSGAGMAENFSQTYLPKSLLIPTCLSQGFEIQAEYDFEPYASWLEIRKPGTLSTVKAHQAMGKILPKQ